MDEQTKLCLDILKFCPCCHVVYFGEDTCSPCSETYVSKRVDLIPIPFDKKEISNAAN